MNKVILIGRLVKDPEVKTTQSQVAVCSFTIAVDRKFKTSEGERQADFISCVAWRQQAEFLGKYFRKGSRVAVVGNLQARSYDDKDSKKVYVTEVVVDEIEFVDSKHDADSTGDPTPSQTEKGAQGSKTRAAAAIPSKNNGFYPTMDDDTTLPFDL